MLLQLLADYWRKGGKISLLHCVLAGIRVKQDYLGLTDCQVNSKNGELKHTG